MNEGYLRQARSRLEQVGAVANDTVAPSIMGSWKRCLGYGLEPRAASRDAVLSVQGFYPKMQQVERVLMFARPEMEILNAQIAGPNTLIAFGDADGTVIETIMGTEIATNDVSKAIIPGSVWDEKIRGTNALGLVAEFGHQISVTGDEHFFSENTRIACAAAPIFSSSGKMAGILDITSTVLNRQRHMATLVTLSAHNVSNRLFIEDHRDDLILLCHPRREFLGTVNAGMLAFDEAGRLTGCSAYARDILGEFPKRDTILFSDVFQMDFARALDSIGRGETVSLRDRTNAPVWARLRLTRGKFLRAAPGSGETVIGLEAIKLPQKPVNASDNPSYNGDELMRQRIQTAVEALEIGLPIRIVGPAGHGLSEIAKTIHTDFAKNDRRIVVDCAAITATHLSASLNGQVFGIGDQAVGPVLKLDEPATIILDGIEKIGAPSRSILGSLAEQIRKINTSHSSDGQSWAFIAIEHKTEAGDDLELSQILPQTAHDIWGFSCEVLALHDRTDLYSVSCRILSDIAPEFTLSRAAFLKLKQLGPRLTFYSLRRLLFQLSRKTDSSIIRDEDVVRLLPWINAKVTACALCSGHPVKEAKCIQIQKVVAKCGGNISLAARRLNSSRTTIYKHVGSEQ